MFWVYIPENPTGKFYVGQTGNLPKRITDLGKNDYELYRSRTALTNYGWPSNPYAPTIIFGDPFQEVWRVPRFNLPELS